MSEVDLTVWVFKVCDSYLLSLTYLFYRLKKGKELEKEEAISEVKKNIHLIKAPHAGKNSSVIVNGEKYNFNRI